MNGIFAFLLAVLIYPGVAAAVLAATALTWTRAAGRAFVTRATVENPVRAIRGLRSALDRDALIPDGAAPRIVAALSLAAIILPLLALILLPVPGNPLVSVIGMTGDLAAEAGLLLGLPVLRLCLGWALPSPYTRLAADRAARNLAGAVVVLALALAATAEQFQTLGLNLAPARTAPATIDIFTRLLALLAAAFVAPLLAHATPTRDGAEDIDLVAGELTELSGADLARFRIGEAIQLAAVAAFFTAVFLLPLFPTVSGAGRAILWILGLIFTAGGIGLWEGYTGGVRASGDRPPLNWWLGLPLLLALLALVAAAWAARG